MNKNKATVQEVLSKLPKINTKEVEIRFNDDHALIQAPIYAQVDKDFLWLTYKSGRTKSFPMESIRWFAIEEPNRGIIL